MGSLQRCLSFTTQSTKCTTDCQTRNESELSPPKHNLNLGLACIWFGLCRIAVCASSPVYILGKMVKAQKTKSEDKRKPKHGLDGARPSKGKGNMRDAATVSFWRNFESLYFLYKLFEDLHHLLKPFHEASKVFSNPKSATAHTQARPPSPAHNVCGISLLLSRPLA